VIDHPDEYPLDVEGDTPEEQEDEVEIVIEALDVEQLVAVLGAIDNHAHN
jgi:hypothetical protein